MNIQNIITKQNIVIFKLLDEKNYSIRELAEAAKCSPGRVHSAVKILLKFGIVKTKRKKNKVLIIANRKNPIYKRVKSLLNIFELTTNRASKKLQKTGVVGIYGSFARGEDTKESDIDLWIFTDKKEIGIRQLIRELENKFRKQINVLMLNKNKLERIRNKDKEFYTRLKLTSTQLNGDIFE